MSFGEITIYVKLNLIFQGLYDVKGWLEPYINTTSRHSKPLHFKFSKDSSCNTVMSYRGRCTRPWMSTAHPILTAIPSGHPSILLPPMFHKINTDALRKNIDRCRCIFLWTRKASLYKLLMQEYYHFNETNTLYLLVIICPLNYDCHGTIGQIMYCS